MPILSGELEGRESRGNEVMDSYREDCAATVDIFRKQAWDSMVQMKSSGESWLGRRSFVRTFTAAPSINTWDSKPLRRRIRRTGELAL